MKTIYFIRHAKSSWDDPMLRDHDRPLNARGLRDAPRMAERLAELGIHPDGILTSSAQRARQTAEYFRVALKIANLQVRIREELYHAWPDTIAQQIRLLPDDWDTVLLFGHNPGYTDLANRLKNKQLIDNVPTCGIIGGKSKAKSWKEFNLRETERVAFLYPKEE